MPWNEAVTISGYIRVSRRSADGALSASSPPKSPGGKCRDVGGGFRAPPAVVSTVLSSPINSGSSYMPEPPPAYNGIILPVDDPNDGKPADVPVGDVIPAKMRVPNAPKAS